MCIPPVIAQAIFGGMYMTAQDYWNLFLETGAPEMYLLFNRARNMEVSNAPDGTSFGFEGNTL